MALPRLLLAWGLVTALLLLWELPWRMVEPGPRTLRGPAWTYAGEGLLLCQWAPDGTAEALYAPDRPVLGLQWHPERQSFALRRPDAADGAPVFRWFRDALTNGGVTIYNTV